MFFLPKPLVTADKWRQKYEEPKAWAWTILGRRFEGSATNPEVQVISLLLNMMQKLKRSPLGKKEGLLGYKILLEL